MNKLNKKPAKTTQIAKISCMLIGTLVCGFMASTANAQKTDGLKIAAGVLDIIGTAVNSGQRQSGRNSHGIQTSVPYPVTNHGNGWQNNQRGRAGQCQNGRNHNNGWNNGQNHNNGWNNGQNHNNGWNNSTPPPYTNGGYRQQVNPPYTGNRYQARGYQPYRGR